MERLLSGLWDSWSGHARHLAAAAEASQGLSSAAVVGGREGGGGGGSQPGSRATFQYGGGCGMQWVPRLWNLWQSAVTRYESLVVCPQISRVQCVWCVYKCRRRRTGGTGRRGSDHGERRTCTNRTMSQRDLSEVSLWWQRSGGRNNPRSSTRRSALNTWFFSWKYCYLRPTCVQ